MVKCSLRDLARFQGFSSSFTIFWWVRRVKEYWPGGKMLAYEIKKMILWPQRPKYCVYLVLATSGPIGCRVWSQRHFKKLFRFFRPFSKTLITMEAYDKLMKECNLVSRTFYLRRLFSITSMCAIFNFCIIGTFQAIWKPKVRVEITFPSTYMLHTRWGNALYHVFINWNTDSDHVFSP